jgi:hypothetical protein
MQCMIALISAGEAGCVSAALSAAHAHALASSISSAGVHWLRCKTALMRATVAASTWLVSSAGFGILPSSGSWSVAAGATCSRQVSLLSCRCDDAGASVPYEANAVVPRRTAENPAHAIDDDDDDDWLPV